MAKQSSLIPTVHLLLVIFCVTHTVLSATTRPIEKQSVKDAVSKAVASSPAKMEVIAKTEGVTKQVAGTKLSATAQKEIAAKKVAVTAGRSAAVADDRSAVVADDTDAPLGDIDIIQTDRRRDVSSSSSAPNALTGNSVPISGRASYNNNGQITENLIQGRQYSTGYPGYQQAPANYPSYYNNYANSKSGGQQPQYPYPYYPYTKGGNQYPYYPYGNGQATTTYPYTNQAYQYPYTNQVYQYPATTAAYQYPTASAAYQYPTASATYQYPAAVPATTYPSGYPNSYNTQYAGYYAQSPTASQGSYGYYSYPSASAAYTYPSYAPASSSYAYPRYY